MNITVTSMKIRVKEVSPSEVEETRDLFRDLLDLTMATLPSFAIQGVTILPKCVGITKIDRRTLFSGMAIRRAAVDQFEHLQSVLHDRINTFLIKNALDVGIPNPVTINLAPIANIESEFVAAPERVVNALRAGPRTSSQIAQATALDKQLNNVLLCLLEEKCLIWRQETGDVDDIFHLVESGSIQKTEETVRTLLQTGPLSRDGVFQAARASDPGVRREWVRKILTELLTGGKVTRDASGQYSLIQ